MVSYCFFSIRSVFSGVLLACCLLLAVPSSLTLLAQDQCPVVTSINFPVDLGIFRLSQDFGAPSPRHQGRFHTGEDFFGGRGSSYGQPVRAIAAGRVTYSAPNGWGRDGGVVIIQHTFPDGSTAYSQYGHMEATDTRPFPARLSCVAAGDIIGVTGNARPAPHLHFEIRTNQPDVPGPGYSWGVPTQLGWLNPSRFVLNWSAWLSLSHLWHVDLNDRAAAAPPLELSDHSLLYLDSDRLRFITPDGRVLWRVNLEGQAVGLTMFQGVPLLTYADGLMQLAGTDGTLGRRWTTGIKVQGAPLVMGDFLVFSRPAGGLVAFAPDRETVAWTIDNVRPMIRGLALPGITGIVTEGDEVLILSPGGRLLDRRTLSGIPALGSDSEGNLLVYSRDGRWRVNPDATWQPSPGGLAALNSSAAVTSPDSRVYSFDGGRLYAAESDNTAVWALDLPDVGGLVELNLYGNVILLTSGYGNVIAVQAGSGALCNSLRAAGDERSNPWHSLGDDGVLRVGTAGAVLGLDWRRFVGGCA